MKLGRLLPMDVRDVWKDEAIDFTPWLARDENIRLLSETIGRDLEVQSVEKRVGPFRADILCKDTVDNSWVLIENQLHRTDHIHLGQLMTYAAGLHTVTIVWISPEFTDEHRAALDWLNEITGEEFSFFGIEVELWRIEDSLAAPKFNIVSKPNDWSKTIAGAARSLDASELTDTKQLQLEFWTKFCDKLRIRNGVIRARKPQPQHWMEFAIGRSHFNLSTTANTRARRIGVELYMSGPNAKSRFNLLMERKQEVERQIGTQLEWEELPHKQDSRVILRRRECDPADRGKWEEQHDWLVEKAELFYRVFAPIVRQLDASDDSIDDQDGHD